MSKENYNLTNIKSNLEEVFKKISTQYDISYDELNNKFIRENSFFSSIIVNESDESIICKAIKQDGFRCTRKSKPNCDFCGKHIKKQTKALTDNNLSITMTNITIDGKNYLVDNNNILFSLPDSENRTTIVGQLKNNNGVLNPSFLSEKNVEMCS